MSMSIHDLNRENNYGRHCQRFKTLDSLRWNKLERSRYCSSLTIPSLLPPEGWTEQMQLPQPFSSVAARGVTAMASRMLSALLPLNDMPFFKFEMGTGMSPDIEVRNYLDSLSEQVYTKLSSGNLREIIYQALQHLIVIGDVLIIMEDDMNFRIVRLDRYVIMSIGFCFWLIKCVGVIKSFGK